MTTVFLVRHGETDFNKDRRIQGGDSDTPLNDHGEQQAQALAARLSKETLKAIYCSPVQGAVNTARAIGAGHHLEVNIEPCFKELNVGALEGVAVSDITEQVNKLMANNPTRSSEPDATAVPEYSAANERLTRSAPRNHPNAAVRGVTCVRH